MYVFLGKRISYAAFITDYLAVNIMFINKYAPMWIYKQNEPVSHALLS